MTTEQDFIDAINADPSNWQLLLVYADWLRERDDSRADGYQAMVALGKSPEWEPRRDGMWGWTWTETNKDRRYYEKKECVLKEWFYSMPNTGRGWHAPNYSQFWDALNACAIGFSRLTVERQKELLEDNHSTQSVTEGSL